MSLLDDKNKVLDRSTDHFLDSISGLERTLYSLVLRILEGFDKERGVLANTNYNFQQVIRSGDEIRAAFAASNLSQKVQDWVFDFDKVFDLNRDYWDGEGVLFNAKINEVLGFEKNQTINKLISDLVGTGVDTNVIQGLQQRIKEGIVTRQKYSELKDVVRNYLITNNTQSRLLRYAGLVTMDSIRGYDGTIQKVVSDEYQMEAFRYVGSLEKDSRKTCIGLIRAPDKIYVPRTKETFSNPYAHLVLADGIYLQKDIAEIIKISQNNPGWNPNTTVNTFFVYRGGYNCTHQALPYKLSTRQKNLYLNNRNN